ncbi:DNA circularization N-terminal domain-containing protein [Gluconacetobacter azotocaptans]|uniref:DNA circularization N-terminal domain-containing protein n=1 Tax=Gluconacetobacter azotocaptans TaxID=142834 RepID=UPI00195D0031|nr:DNA circularization N-terminal domain-containing protein [Gluconacetobacter azotocaptans]MBM9400384.1 DNA circularization N-terminal domain-containing protein [Gluconacetobacter azotocaptans]
MSLSIGTGAIGSGTLGSQLGMTGGLLASSLGSILATAAWRGVTFYMPNSEEIVGRRLLQMFFPGLDQYKVQDLGALEGPIRVRGLIVGDDYVIRAQRMRKAFLAVGPATLVHPWWGEIRCRLLEPGRISFAENEIRLARFEAVFIREPVVKGASGWLSSIVDTLSNLMEKADALVDSAVLAAREVLAPLVLPLALAGSVSSIVSQASGVWDALTGSAPQPVQAAVAGPLATLSAGVAPPASNGSTVYADAVTGALAGVPAAIVDAIGAPAGAAVALSGVVANGAALDAAVDAPTALAILLAGADQIGAAARAIVAGSPTQMAALTLGLVARSATMAQAIAAQASQTYASQQDALASRDQVTAALDALSADIAYAVGAGAGVASVMTMQDAVRAARAAVVADISSRLGRLPAVVDVPVPAQTSAWLIAYAVAGDDPGVVQATFDDLVTRNALRHPALAGPGTVEVLEAAS